MGAGKPINRLFGMKFGTVIPAKYSCTTNSYFECDYRYYPSWRNEVQGVVEYHVITTLITKRVFEVQCRWNKGSPESLSHFHAFLNNLVKNYGAVPRREKKSRALFYEIGSKYVVYVTDNDYESSIRAVDKKLQSVAYREHCEGKAQLRLRDLAALDIQPEKALDEIVINRIDSVFGVYFGESLSGEEMERSELGPLAWHIESAKSFLHCDECQALVSGPDNEVFMIRAFFRNKDVDITTDAIKERIK